MSGSDSTQCQDRVDCRPVADRPQPDVVPCPSKRPVALTIAGVSGVLLQLASSGPDSYQYRHPTPFTRCLSTRCFRSIAATATNRLSTHQTYPSGHLTRHTPHTPHTRRIIDGGSFLRSVEKTHDCTSQSSPSTWSQRARGAICIFSASVWREDPAYRLSIPRVGGRPRRFSRRI